MSLAINFAEKKIPLKKKNQTNFLQEKNNNCAFYFYALLL